MPSEQLQSILDNPDMVFVFAFAKNDKYYVHPVVVQGSVGAHGQTVSFPNKDEATASVMTLMQEIEAPLYTWGNIDPRLKKFYFTVVRSTDGSKAKDAEWEKTDGSITFEELERMFAGGEIHEDLIAMMEDRTPPNAIDGDVLDILVSNKNGGETSVENMFVPKMDKTIN